MSKSLIGVIAKKAFSQEIQTFKGWFGEVLTEKELLIVNLFGRNGKILHNVYIPKDDGDTTEIDVMYITQKGIFVFESKNYSGWIFGDESSLKWMEMLPNKTKNQFYNPIMQNKNHLKWLSNYLGESIPLFSIIVFSERCELKKVSVTSQNIKVIKRDKTYSAVKSLWDNAPDALDESTMQRVYDRLSNLTNADAAMKATHIENIKKKLDVPMSETSKRTVTKSDVTRGSVPRCDVEDTATVVEEKICPKCGNKLVLRTATKGANAGRRFYGCSGYPGCRYIENV